MVDTSSDEPQMAAVYLPQFVPKPEKYSEAYFEDRIASLRSKIQQVIPSKEELDSDSIFSSVILSLEAAKQTLETSKTIVTALQNEQIKHPDDDSWKDASVVDPSAKAVKDAQAVIDRLEEAGTNTGSALVRASGLLDGGLSQIEHDLLECTVLIQATPKKLATWCAESPGANPQLLDQFLGRENNSTTLMELFLASGGPSNGNYGPALNIYDKLQNENGVDGGTASMTSTEPFSLKQRLALAVALELSTPIPIFQQENEFVDPVERFRYFAKFADNKNGDKNDLESCKITFIDTLDDAFFTLSVWELRKVVDANASNDDLTWGRSFLRNYRPDQIFMEDQRWRYVMSVRSDVGYRHPDHEFRDYPALLSAGGECGARAWFGRFISKAWGIPTWGVRQPGHAAMTRWTNDRSIGGWTVCLGAPWQYSWWDDNRYGANTRRGPDFLEETQARTSADRPRIYYEKVILLECLAESLGETVEEDFVSAKVWRSLALSQRKMMSRSFCSTSVKSLGTGDTNGDKFELNGSVCNEFGFPRASKIQHQKTIKEQKSSYDSSNKDTNPDRSLKGNDHLIQPDGTIIIPATSFVDPKRPPKNVMVTKSFLGGNQLHLEHDGQVEYILPHSIVAAGTYAMSAKVVNVHRDQKPLIVQIENPPVPPNHSYTDGYEIVHLPQGQEMEVQYTKGKWEQTKSIRVDLIPRGRLRLSRVTPCWGLSIKELWLCPVNY